MRKIETLLSGLEIGVPVGLGNVWLVPLLSMTALLWLRPLQDAVENTIYGSSGGAKSESLQAL